MAIPTIRELLEKKGFKLGSSAGQKKFEVPEKFFKESPLIKPKYVPQIQTGSRYTPPSPQKSPLIQNIEEPTSSQPFQSVIPQTQLPATQERGIVSKVVGRMAEGKELAAVYNTAKGAAKVAGIGVGGVLGAGAGLIGGLVNYVGEATKQSKDLLLGKTTFKKAQKSIWDSTIKGAKDTAQFGYKLGSGATSMIPDLPAMPAIFLIQSGKSIADTFSETGTLYEKYKQEGNKNPGIYATYDNLKIGSQKGWELLGADKELAKKVSQNPILGAMGNLILYGSAYLGARGVAKEVQWATSKLPILEMKPTGNRVIMSQDTYNQIRLDTNFKDALKGADVQVIEGGGGKVAITFADLQKIKPDAIQALLNKNKAIPGFLELKEFERTAWGALQSKIENGKLVTPKTSYQTQYTPAVLPTPIKYLGQNEPNAPRVPAQTPALAQGKTMTPQVVQPIASFQMLDSSKLKGTETLLKKLKTSLAKKDAIISKANPTAKDISEVKNLRSVITNLENTLATTQRNAVTAQGPSYTLKTVQNNAQPATTNVKTVSETGEVPVQANIERIPVVEQPLPERQQVALEETPISQFVINEVNQKTLAPTGNKYNVTLSKTNGKATFKKYQLSQNGEKKLVSQIPEERAQKIYLSKDPGYIAQRMVNEVPSVQKIQPELKLDKVYYKPVNGRLNVDKNGNVNLTTEKVNQYGEQDEIDVSKLKIKNFNTQKELFDASKNKEKYQRQGYDILMSGNRAIAISPRVFATKVGVKTIETGRQQIGALMKRAQSAGPIGRPKKEISEASLEREGLKRKAQLRQEARQREEVRQQKITSEERSRKEAENARILQIKQELSELKRQAPSKVIVKQLTKEELTKPMESHFISKTEKQNIEKEIEQENQIDRVNTSRKAVNDEKYKQELLALKERGKGQEFFLDLYTKEFDKELNLHEKGVIAKSDVILDFIENQYGFNVIKNILQPVKNIENFLNMGVQKFHQWWWKETGAKNAYALLQNKLKVNNFTSLIGRKLVYQYGLPQWYKDLKVQVDNKNIKDGDIARNVMENLVKGLTENEKVELHGAIINYGQHPNPNIESRAKFAREILDRMGDEYWKSGAISREVYEANKGQYLPRLYFGKEIAEPLTEFVKAGGFKAGLERTKKRGLEKIVSENNLDEWTSKGWQVRSNTQEKGKVRIWRDYTTEERQAMGEIISEPSYLVAKGIQQIGYDTAILNLFNEVKQYPEFVQKEAFADFVRLPDSKGYGALRNMYVDKFIAEDIKGMVTLREQATNFGNMFISEWKRWKVVDNPATHFRNMYFNFILSDIAGLSPTRVDVYGSALIDIVKKQGDYKDAHDAGLFGTSWFGNELKEILEPAQVKRVLQMNSKGIYDVNFSSQLGGSIMEVGKLLKRVYDKTQGKLGSLYEAEEHWNKMALYKFAKYDLEMSVGDSVAYAKKWGLNYSAVTPWVAKYSQKWYGAPFLRFQTLAAPRLAESVVMRPFTILKWVLFTYLVQDYARKKLGYTWDQIKQIKENLFPNWMQNGLYVLAPKTDENGNPQFLDLTYIVPFIEEAKNPLGQLYNYSFGNPTFKIPAELMLNRSAFTGLDIYDPIINPEFSERMKIYTKYIYEQIMPSMAPGNYSFNKLLDGIKNKPDYAGRINDTFSSITSTIFGLKLRSVDLKAEEKWRLIELKQKDSEYAKEIMSVQLDKSLTESQRKKEILRLTEIRKKNIQKALDINKVNQPETQPYINFFLD